MTRLRIANFTFSYAPLMTGISALVHDRVRLYLEKGHEVHLIHPHVESAPAAKGSGNQMYSLADLKCFPQFHSWTFPTRRHPIRSDFHEARRAKYWDDTKLLEHIQPDVVVVDEALGLAGFSSFGWGGYGRTMGTRYAREHGISSFNLMHGDWLGYSDQSIGKIATACLRPLLRRFTRKIAAAYTRTFSPSQFLRQKYQHDFDGRIEHLRFHGVNLNDFTPDNLDFDPIPDVSDPVILYTGRVAIEKSIDVLLNAYSLVRESLPNACLYVLGSGPTLEKYRRKAARRFGDRVCFPGAANGNELKGWYARADVYWTASVTENFSMAILEALASGTPVIASAAGGNVEQILDGYSGYLVTPKSHREMAQKTIELLSNPEQLALFSRQARESAYEFDGVPAMKRLLDELVSASMTTIKRAAA